MNGWCVLVKSFGFFINEKKNGKNLHGFNCEHLCHVMSCQGNWYLCPSASPIFEIFPHFFVLFLFSIKQSLVVRSFCFVLFWKKKREFFHLISRLNNNYDYFNSMFYVLFYHLKFVFPSRNCSPIQQIWFSFNIVPEMLYARSE